MNIQRKNVFFYSNEMTIAFIGLNPFHFPFILCTFVKDCFFVEIISYSVCQCQCYAEAWNQWFFKHRYLLKSQTEHLTCQSFIKKSLHRSLKLQKVCFSGISKHAPISESLVYLIRFKNYFTRKSLYMRMNQWKREKMNGY